jgi:hypothetical protein
VRLRLLVAALALAGLGACAFEQTRTERYVVARATSGRVVARVPLPPRGRFALSYIHSIYEAPGVERFAARGNGFTLIGLSSPSSAVLDYYGLEGRRSKKHGWWSLAPASRPRYEELPVIATDKGRRALVVSGTTVPLFERGRAVHLTLSVSG